MSSKSRRSSIKSKPLESRLANIRNSFYIDDPSFHETLWKPMVYLASRIFGSLFHRGSRLSSPRPIAENARNDGVDRTIVKRISYTCRVIPVTFAKIRWKIFDFSKYLKVKYSSYKNHCRVKKLTVVFCYTLG